MIIKNEYERLLRYVKAYKALDISSSIYHGKRKEYIQAIDELMQCVTEDIVRKEQDLEFDKMFMNKITEEIAILKLDKR